MIEYFLDDLISRIQIGWLDMWITIIGALIMRQVADLQMETLSRVDASKQEIAEVMLALYGTPHAKEYRQAMLRHAPLDFLRFDVIKQHLLLHSTEIEQECQELEKSFPETINSPAKRFDLKKQKAGIKARELLAKLKDEDDDTKNQDR